MRGAEWTNTGAPDGPAEAGGGVELAKAAALELRSGLSAVRSEREDEPRIPRSCSGEKPLTGPSRSPSESKPASSDSRLAAKRSSLPSSDSGSKQEESRAPA